jgi:hypothetical protein
MANKNVDYHHLYLKILEIGRGRLKDGLSYNELITLLKKDHYDLDNGCVELAIKHWFDESFFHLGQDSNPYSCLKDLPNHLDCSFVLKGEHSLRLIEHTTTKRNFTISIIALIIAFISLIVSFIVLM